MAKFIIVAKYGSSFTNTTTPYYTDVPATNIFFSYIQKMKDAGITATSGSYFPDTIMTRDGMAAFLGRAFLGMQ